MKKSAYNSKSADYYFNFVICSLFPSTYQVCPLLSTSVSEGFIPKETRDVEKRKQNLKIPHTRFTGLDVFFDF